MKLVYLVLCLLPFLSGCAASTSNKQDASLSPTEQQEKMSQQCVDEKWGSCR